MNKSEVLAHAKPVKRLKFRKFLHNFKMLWYRLLVWLGWRVWVKRVYSRPKYQICVFHECKMKLIGKTQTGGRYLCKKCLKEHGGNPRKAIYHLEGCGSKVAPMWQRTR